MLCVKYFITFAIFFLVLSCNQKDLVHNENEYPIEYDLEFMNKTKSEYRIQFINDNNYRIMGKNGDELFTGNWKGSSGNWEGTFNKSDTIYINSAFDPWTKDVEIKSKLIIEEGRMLEVWYKIGWSD